MVDYLGQSQNIATTVMTIAVPQEEKSRMK